LEAIAVAQRLQTINIDNLEDVDDAKESASDFGGRIEVCCFYELHYAVASGFS
jgi:hypothetical protein